MEQHPTAARTEHARPFPLRPVLTGVVCGLAYFLVLEAFLAIPILNGTTQVRPAAGVGPALGLFFGWPAIVGCGLGNALSDFLHGETDLAMLAVYTLIQMVYNAIPYLLWYAVFRKSDRPYPRLDSAYKIAAYLIISVVAATAVTLLLMPFEEDTMSAMDIHFVRMLNNLLFLIYLGMPLLIALERSSLAPTATRFVRQRLPYRERSRMNLTQRLLAGATGVFVFMLALYVGVAYAPYVVVGAIQTADDVAELVGSIYLVVALFTVVAYLPLVFVLRHVERNYTRPLEYLTDESRDFVKALDEARESGGELAVKPLDETGLRLKNEIADLFFATDSMRRQIDDYLARLKAATAERERAAAELDIASRIQTGAVPHDFALFKERFHLDIEAFLRPAREVGGDFYDVFEAGPGRVGFVIADVSGKGVPAALFMMRAQAEIREQMLSYADLGEAFMKANSRLCEHNDALLFVTVFGCVLDVRSGRLTFANAGHNPPWLRHGSSREWLREKPGLVMGAMDTAVYRSHELQLQPHDGLFLYTDGVNEAANDEQRFFGTERLEETLRSVHGGTAHDAIRSVLRAVEAFEDGAPQADDITMLAFTWKLPVDFLTLPPKDEALDDLFAFVEKVCDDAGASKKTLLDMQLVLEELFVNIAHYGFPEGHPQQPVNLQTAVDATAGCVHATLSDSGIPYDPFTYVPELPAPGKDLKVGGLGILLARKLTEHMSYERLGGQNVVHLVFKLR